LIGLLRRVNVIRAYDVALTRRAALRHQAHQLRLGAVAGIEVVEFAVEVGSPIAGLRISQVTWPRDSMVATLRRGRRLLIPHGDTRSAGPPSAASPWISRLPEPCTASTIGPSTPIHYVAV
jgi:CIC family chloride channel protein